MHLTASPLHTASPIRQTQGGMVPDEFPISDLHLQINETYICL